MFIVDIEERFGTPNTALRVEVAAVKKRPSASEEEVEITEDMVKCALEQSLNSLDCASDKSTLSQWFIEVKENGVRFTRMHEGRPVEDYGVVPLEKAAIYAVAITQGFQPPRALLACDKPIG
jgi:phosphoribosylformylglycinamidine (FGAM) synthase-like enzyme